MKSHSSSQESQPMRFSALPSQKSQSFPETPQPPDEIFSPRSSSSEFFSLPEKTVNQYIQGDVSEDVIAAISQRVGLFLSSQTEPGLDFGGYNPFDSPCEPSISLPNYFDRIQRYSHLSPETIICGVVLLRRVLAESGLVLTNLSGHRLLAASLRVSSKVYEDEVDDRKLWKRIVGLHRLEMNNLEVEMLNRLNYRLRVSAEEFHEVVLMISAFLNVPLMGLENVSDSADLRHLCDSQSKGHAWESSSEDSFQTSQSSLGAKIPRRAVSVADSSEPKSERRSSIWIIRRRQIKRVYLRRFGSDSCIPESEDLSEPVAAGDHSPVGPSRVNYDMRRTVSVQYMMEKLFSRPFPLHRKSSAGS